MVKVVTIRVDIDKWKELKKRLVDADKSINDFFNELIVLYLNAIEAQSKNPSQPAAS